jgi:O-antigen/teichoic acid export membrane protein
LFSINEFKKMKSKNFLLKGHGARKKYFSTGIRPKDVLKDSWPFSFAAFFYFVYFQSDVILVKYFVGDAEAGLYNVAFTILAAIYIFPNVVYQKFLMPKIHRWASNDRLMFRRVYVKGNQWMLIIGLVFMLIAWFVIPFFVPFFFGVEYGESNKYLKILIVSVPIMFVASSAGAAMTTSSHMKIKIKFMGIVAILNVLLNLIAIPKYGAAGAAYVTVISNSLLLSLYLYGAEVFVFNDTKNGFIN